MATSTNSATAIQTITGIFFDPFDPDPSAIRIEDIAHALTMQCRYGGHVRKRWSVAQHSLMVSDLCPPELRLAGLLHDAAEAYLVDLPRPIKHHPEMIRYRMVEAHLDRAIGERFGFPFPMSPTIKAADNRVLVAEAYALKHGVNGWLDHKATWEIELDLHPDAQLVTAIRNAAPPTDEYVRDEFINAFHALGGK